MNSITDLEKAIDDLASTLQSIINGADLYIKLIIAATILTTIMLAVIMFCLVGMKANLETIKEDLFYLRQRK